MVPSAADDQDTCEFPSLRILDLASNNFSGTLTKKWFTRLKSMIVKTENETQIIEYEGPVNDMYKITTLITYSKKNLTS